MRRRVVVTGMGAITPIGNSVEEFWNAVREEKTGFGEITHFDASGSVSYTHLTLPTNREV